MQFRRGAKCLSGSAVREFRRESPPRRRSGQRWAAPSSTNAHQQDWPGLGLEGLKVVQNSAEVLALLGKAIKHFRERIRARLTIPWMKLLMQGVQARPKAGRSRHGIGWRIWRLDSMATTPIVPQPNRQSDSRQSPPAPAAALQQQMAQTQPQAQQGTASHASSGGCQACASHHGQSRHLNSVQCGILPRRREHRPCRSILACHRIADALHSANRLRPADHCPTGNRLKATRQNERAKELLKNGSWHLIASRTTSEGTQFGQNHPLLGKISGIGASGSLRLWAILACRSLSGLRAALQRRMIPGTAGYHAAQFCNVGRELASG